jgi:hypothetical protein
VKVNLIKPANNKAFFITKSLTIIAFLWFSLVISTNVFYDNLIPNPVDAGLFKVILYWFIHISLLIGAWISAEILHKKLWAKLIKN